MEKARILASTAISPLPLVSVLERNRTFSSLTVVRHCRQPQAVGYRQLCGSIGQLQRALLGVGLEHALGTRTCTTLQVGAIKDNSISTSTDALSGLLNAVQVIDTQQFNGDRHV